MASRSDWLLGKQEMTITKDLVESSDCLAYFYFTKGIYFIFQSLCLIG